MIGRGYPCVFCGSEFETFALVRSHVGGCPVRRKRVAALPADLVSQVQNRTLTLDEAEAMSAKRPSLVL